jgi:subtilisin family serine protease
VWFVRVVGTLALIKRLVDVERRSADEVMRMLPGRHAETAEAYRELLGGEPAEQREKKPALLWSVSLNRPVLTSVAYSALTVKADAARQLFNLDTDNLAWAVVDSGIDLRHIAFRRRARTPPFKPEGEDEFDGSQVVATYDFTRARRLLADPGWLIPGGNKDDPESIEEARRALRRRLRAGRPLDWAVLSPLLEIPHTARAYREPRNDHGTHVAGILAGNWRRGEPHFPVSERNDLIGVCPGLRLYDLRVLGDDGKGDEFGVLSALQFIRWLNMQHDEPKIHGVNLSLSMKHDVANFACGRTPVCDECERLVASGVVVVAAAGNDGYTTFTTPTGDSEGYRSISISDPGNAEDVITVGATHRRFPHTYGVSYFSSRGPTGDGRRKPDLVAPGEKITGPTPNNGSAIKDGTSMAAPHVSGAVALLMARHRELVGQHMRIKEILCRTATDLKREVYFQGHGLVDILRALQSL